MAVLAGACSTSGGEIVTKPDDVTTGAAGTQSVPLAGRAGASGTAGTGGAAGGGGVAPTAGGFGGQAAGAGGSPLTCPPDGAKVPDCTDVSAQSCAGCVCGAPDGCLDAWTACRADVGCARGLGCILAGCASQTCAVVAGQGHAMLVSVVACFGGECSTRCTGEAGTGGAGGSSGAAGKAGGGGKAGAAGGAANGGAGGGPPPSGMAGLGGSGG